MPLVVHIHASFFYGDLNNGEWIDLPFMSDAQIQALSTFVSKVTNGDLLRGVNKPSYDTARSQFQAFWEEYGAWHYHCGPTMVKENAKCFSIDLNENHEGDTSEEVIHYSKLQDNSVVIFGFSPVHVPFPAPDVEQYIFTRLENIDDIVQPTMKIDE